VERNSPFKISQPIYKQEISNSTNAPAGSFFLGLLAAHYKIIIVTYILYAVKLYRFYLANYRAFLLQQKNFKV